jgi:ABC-2 type transport system permease protein
MKQLFVFIRKEFYHVFRDPRTLLIMFGLPLAQIILFGYALTSEVKNAEIVISDNSKDVQSMQITNKIKASSYFNVTEASMDIREVEKTFKQGKIKCAVVFPTNFSRDLLQNGNAQIQIIADGSDPNTSKTIINYLTSIITDFQRTNYTTHSLSIRIIPETRMLYNEESNGSLNYIPGVMALILMIVCTTLTSVSIVKEKELGTMEVLLVSPFKPIRVLISKAVPYLILSLLNFAFILLLSVFLLHVEIKGNLFLLFLESTLFIITCLSFGLLISNTTSSQQTALLLSMMGMMLPTLIFTGFLIPLENMPWILQLFANIVPAKWYYIIVKSVMLKGLGFQYVWKETGILIGMTLLLLAISLKNFKIRLQ